MYCSFSLDTSLGHTLWLTWWTTRRWFVKHICFAVWMSIFWHQQPEIPRVWAVCLPSINPRVMHIIIISTRRSRNHLWPHAVGIVDSQVGMRIIKPGVTIKFQVGCAILHYLFSLSLYPSLFKTIYIYKFYIWQPMHSPINLSIYTLSGKLN